MCPDSPPAAVIIQWDNNQACPQSWATWTPCFIGNKKNPPSDHLGLPPEAVDALGHPDFVGKKGKKGKDALTTGKE